MILIYGRDERAVEAGNLLKDHLDVTVLIKPPAGVTPPRVTDFPVVKGAIRSAKGYLGAFEAARAANLATLMALSADQWFRSGTQEGVGLVSLRDMPALMRQHDESHRAEIRDWQQRFGHRTEGA